MAWGGQKVTAARAMWAKRLPLPCSKCKRPVTADQAWHVDHVIPRSQGGPEGVENQWPAHARCNTRDGGKAGARITNAKRAPVSTRRLEDRPLAW